MATKPAAQQQYEKTSQKNTMKKNIWKHLLYRNTVFVVAELIFYSTTIKQWVNIKKNLIF